MNTYHRRYIFVDFDDLKKVKFKKLGKVCDRVYIFISADEESIPFQLVMHMQKMGKAVKWVLVEGISENSMALVMSFVMGRLHQKMDKTVEFAVLSNNPSFEPLVGFISKSGRSCVRVRREKSENESGNEKMKLEFFDKNGEEKKHSGNENGSDNGVAGILTEQEELIGRTAEETIKRLIRSGNRPSNVHLLKEYILLNNQELTLHGNVERVIKKLEETHEIRFDEEEIVYNF